MNSPDRSPPFDVPQFRQQVRDFLKRQFPADLDEKARTHAYFSKEDRVRWQRILQQRGWFAAHWPAAYGGADWGPLQRFILIEELEFAGAPWITHFGVSFAGPVIYTYGDEAQKSRHLPDILHSNVWWAQGFSEPGAGSDLASVRTRAVLCDDHYRVSGQKTWATMAQWADMMFTLVRTGDTDRPHAGLSLLLVDLHSPGVSVRPIATIDGVHHVNDVFFDDVKVPVANLVGREGDGWTCVKLIVGNERPLVTELGKSKRLMAMLRELTRAKNSRTKPQSPPQCWQQRLADLEVRLATLQALAYDTFDQAQDATPQQVEASTLKIRGSETQQAILDAIMDALGPDGLPFEVSVIDGGQSQVCALGGLGTRLAVEHLYSRAASIYGGSNEIQRQIIAKSILGS